SLGTDHGAGAAGILILEVFIGLGLLEVGNGLVQGGLEKPAINLKEKVSLVGVVALLERRLYNVTAHTGANVNCLQGIQPSGEVLEVGHNVLDRASDNDGNFFLLRWRRRLVATRHEYGKSRTQQSETKHGHRTPQRRSNEPTFRGQMSLHP